MIISLNITIILLLFLTFYQDMKERKVMLIVLVALFILSGFLHSQFYILEIFLLNVLLNITIVSLVLFILFLYTRFVLHKKLFEAFGLGDAIFFLILSISFPIPTFLVIFSSSLLFAFILSIGLKKSMKDKTIPLAGFQALFVLLILLSNLLFNFTNLYQI
ncbi:MAG: general secretion pathway protein [Flavobacteriaceae bacterium]